MSARRLQRLAGTLVVALPALLLGLTGCSAKALAPGVTDVVTFADGVSHAEIAPGDDAKPSDVQGNDATPGEVVAEACLAANDPKAVCDDDGNCTTGEYCDECTRVCRPSRKLCEPCTADEQCAKAIVDKKPFSACLAYKDGGTFCGLGCLGDAACGAGFQCLNVTGVGVKQCVPKSGSCAPGSGSCKADGDCPFQFVCNVEYAACVKGCTADGMCATGQVCSLGHCVAPCVADGECTTLIAEAKCIDKHCKIPGGCIASEECDEKQTHCDLKTHKCVPGCEVPSDCKDLAMKCEGGQCVEKGCTMNWQCGYYQLCDAATAKCVPATGKYCEPCNPKDENVPECGGKPELCVTFKDQADVEKGSFCAITCTESATGPCPQGWACQELKDDKGASKGKYCLRPCYSKPVGTP